MRGRRICIVADDETLASLLVDILEEEGCEAQLYLDAVTALAAIDPAPPDLIIVAVDWSMQPHCIHLLQALRGHHLTGKLPVIVISADPDLLRQESRLLTEFNCRMLEKPFELDVLLNLVATLLAARRRQD